VLSHRRGFPRLALSESKTVALDFRVFGDGYGLLGERSAVWQIALLCNRAALDARSSIRHSVGLQSPANAARDFSERHSRYRGSRLFGRDTAWQISEKSLRRERILLMADYEGVSRIQIEVLYFDDCPNHLPTVVQVNKVLREESYGAEVREIRVPDAETAQRVKFLGSPTVRGNGIDIEPSAQCRMEFGLMCRRYTGGVLSDELIRSALRSAVRKEGEEQ
jgi:hypothetical protein